MDLDGVIHEVVGLSDEDCRTITGQSVSYYLHDCGFDVLLFAADTTATYGRKTTLILRIINRSIVPVYRKIDISKNLEHDNMVDVIISKP